MSARAKRSYRGTANNWRDRNDDRLRPAKESDGDIRSATEYAVIRVTFEVNYKTPTWRRSRSTSAVELMAGQAAVDYRLTSRAPACGRVVLQQFVHGLVLIHAPIKNGSIKPV
jgi:hypothetical protein